MSEAYMGEIRLMSFNFAPKFWALCNGQSLPVNQNQALFSLLGTAYGGDGRTTFNLPDLRGRVPMGFNGSHPQGQKAGEESHALAISEMPQHNHTMQAKNAAADAGAGKPGPTLALAQASVTLNNQPAAVSRYATSAPDGTMASAALANTGAGQGHETRQPFSVISMCICLQGVFPSRS